MQYRKHNFAYNFQAAAGIDPADAWEILTGEINNLSLDAKYKQQSIGALRAQGYPVADTISARNLSLLLFESLYGPAAGRSTVLQLIDGYHSSPFVTAETGPLDQLPMDAPQTPAAALEKLLTDPEPELSKENIRTLLVKDLQNKQQMRGMRTPLADRMQNTSAYKALLIAAGLSAMFFLGVSFIWGKKALPFN